MFGFNPLYAALYAAGLAGPVPAYSLDFMAGTIPAGITFSRGSQATMIGSTGLMEYAPHNLIPRSEPLGGTAGSPGVAPTGWTSMTTSGSGLTRTLAFGTLPTGEAYVDVQFTGTSTVAGTLVIDPVVGNVVGASIAQPFSGSMMVALVQGSMPVGRQWSVRLIERSSAQAYLADTVVNITPTADMTRYSVSRVLTSSSTAFVQLALRLDGMQIGDVFNLTLRVAAPQLNVGYSSSTYYATTGSVYYGPRFEYDPVTLQPNGLLIEAGRTNLVSFWRGALSITGGTQAINAAGADGVANVAATVTESSAIVEGHFAQAAAGVNFTSGTTYAMTRLIKPGTANRVQLTTNAALSSTGAYVNFSLTGEGSILASGGGGTGYIRPHGNGFYACTIVFTASSTQSGIAGIVAAMINSDTAGRIPTYTGTGLTLVIDGNQIEAGSFPTSIIPTFGTSTGTRAADSLTTTSMAWLNPAAGTIVSEYMRPILAPAQHVVSLSDNGSFNNIIYQAGGSGSPGQRRFDVTAGGVNQAQIQLSSAQVAGVVYKDAMRWSLNDFAASENGGAVQTDTVGTIPTPLNLLSLSTGQTTMYIRRFSYYNTALTNTQLVTLSAV